MNFEACLSLPRDPREAGLIADNLEALAGALRDWPAEAWQRVLSDETQGDANGLFERLVARTAPAAVDKHGRSQALTSAEACADVLRVMEPNPPDAEVGRLIKSAVADHGEIGELLAGCAATPRTAATITCRSCGVSIGAIVQCSSEWPVRSASKPPPRNALCHKRSRCSLRMSMPMGTGCRSQ